MRRSLRAVLTITGAAALLIGASPAHADTQGTPNEPPPDLPPPAPPPPSAPAGPVVVAEPQQVPTYGQYEQRRRTERTHWYGWQNLLVDGSVIVASAGLGAANGSAGGVLLGTGYLFGGPIVHWSHGQIGRGFASLGIRGGAPLVFGALGYLAFHGDSSGADLGGFFGFVLGFGFGALSAIVIDAAALAYEKVDDDQDEDARAVTRRRQAQRPITWSPWAAPRTEGGAMFGLSGTL